MNYKLIILLFFPFFFFSCSSYPEMDKDILAYYIYNQSHLDLSNSSDDYVSMLSLSLGMDKNDIIKIQKHIASKKTSGKLKEDYEIALRKKVFELLQRKKDSARKDFVVNVLAPYLDGLSRNESYKSDLETQAFEKDIFLLYEKFFPEENGLNTLRNFITYIHRFYNGEVVSIDNLNDLNINLAKYGLWVDCTLQGSSTVFQIQDTIMPPTPFKGNSISILNLKRFIPGLLPPFSGYFTIGAQTVIVIDDMVAINTESKIMEQEKSDFIRYNDHRFVQFWRNIGLDLNLFKANDVYMKLMSLDLKDNNFEFLKRANQINTVIHEGKHLADNIEHPEIALNLDREFSAHITEAIYSPIPYIALFAAIERMQNYALFHKHPYLNNVVRQLWEMAIQSANDSSYTRDALRTDLIDLYNNYRTIRNNLYFERLNDFEDVVIAGIRAFYSK